MYNFGGILSLDLIFLPDGGTRGKLTRSALSVTVSGL